MKEFLNGSTAFASILLVFDTMLWCDSWRVAYMTLSVVLFAAISSMNHLFTLNLKKSQSTHLVKALFTHMLGSFIGIPIVYSMIVSIFDIMPFLVKQYEAHFEAVGVVYRLCLKFFMIFHIISVLFIDPNQLQIPIEVMGISIESEAHTTTSHSPKKYLFIFYLLCEIIYYYERKTRIKSGIRFDYSFYHNFEHCGLIILFTLFNNSYSLNKQEFGSINISFTKICLAQTIFMFILAGCIRAFNQTIFQKFQKFQKCEKLQKSGLNLHTNAKNIIDKNGGCTCSSSWYDGFRVPDWFIQHSRHEPQLIKRYKYKLSRNAGSLKLYNHICKNYDRHLSLQIVTWHTIESMIDTIVEKNANYFDQIKNLSGNDKRNFTIVGIFSGGGFIVPYLCKKMQLPFENCVFLKSSFWSNQTLYSNARNAFLITICGFDTFVESVVNGDFDRSLSSDPRLNLSGLNSRQIEDESKRDDKLVEEYNTLLNQIQGKNILLVDDSICSGVTLVNVKTRIMRMNPNQCHTLTLYAGNHAPIKPDFYYTTGRTPLIWPWGYECD